MIRVRHRQEDCPVLVLISCSGSGFWRSACHRTCCDQTRVVHLSAWIEFRFCIAGSATALHFATHRIAASVCDDQEHAIRFLCGEHLRNSRHQWRYCTAFPRGPRLHAGSASLCALTRITTLFPSVPWRPWRKQPAHSKSAIGSTARINYAASNYFVCNVAHRTESTFFSA